MKIAVVGVGAVGGYFGGLLAEEAGGEHEIIFIARGATLNAMLDSGLHIESVVRNVIVKQPRATNDPASVGPVDVVLLTVKSWQVAAAAEMMRPLVGAHTLIVPLQNGVDSPAQLSACFEPDNVLGGMCKIGSRVVAPAKIEHFGIEPSLVFGHLDGRTSPRANELRDALLKVGVAAEVPRDVRIPIWEKFLLIASWSGLGAVTRAPIGVLRELPATRSMLESAMREVADVGSAVGVNLADDIVARTMSFIDTVTPGATASMQRDLAMGKRSELMSQTAAVVRRGAEHGCSTPVNEFLFHCLLPLELKAQGKVTFADV